MKECERCGRPDAFYAVEIVDHKGQGRRFGLCANCSHQIAEFVTERKPLIDKPIVAGLMMDGE